MGPGLAEMSNRCIVLDKKMCPDPLEALKPSGGLLKCFKIGELGVGRVVAHGECVFLYKINDFQLFSLDFQVGGCVGNQCSLEYSYYTFIETQ